MNTGMAASSFVIEPPNVVLCMMLDYVLKQDPRVIHSFHEQYPKETAVVLNIKSPNPRKTLEDAARNAFNRFQRLANELG